MEDGAGAAPDGEPRSGTEAKRERKRPALSSSTTSQRIGAQSVTGMNRTNAGFAPGTGSDANSGIIGITPVKQFHPHDPILLPVIPTRLALSSIPGGPVAPAG